MFSALLVFAVLGEPRLLTLEEALATARQHQPQLRQAQAGAAAAQARARQARAGLLPTLSASASYQRQTANFAPRPGTLPTDVAARDAEASGESFDYFNFGLNATQLVYDFGQTTGRYAAARATAEARGEDERATLLSITEDVRAAFFAARAQRALLGVAKETLENQERHLEQIDAFVRVGTRPAIDLAQVRTDRANAVVQLVNAENGYATAKVRLSNAMGVTGPTDFEVADESLPPVPGEDEPLEGLVDEALAGRPEVKALRASVRAQESTVRSLMGDYGPSLGIGASASEAGGALDALTWNWVVGATLSWPLFLGGLTVAQVSEAEATLSGLAAQRDGLEQAIRLEVEQARLAVRAGKATLEATGQAVEAARERLRLAEGRYSTGVGSIIELGDAQLALTGAEAQSVQADFNLAAARAQLLRALGRA